MGAQWPDEGTGQPEIHYQMQDLMRQRQKLAKYSGPTRRSRRGCKCLANVASPPARPVSVGPLNVRCVGFWIEVQCSKFAARLRNEGQDALSWPCPFHPH